MVSHVRTYGLEGHTMLKLFGIIATIVAFVYSTDAKADQIDGKNCDAAITDQFEKASEKDLGPGYGSFQGLLEWTWIKKSRDLSVVKSGKDDDYAWRIETFKSTRCLRISLESDGSQVIWSWTHGALEIGGQTYESKVFSGRVPPFTVKVWHQRITPKSYASFYLNHQGDEFTVRWSEPEGGSGEGSIRRVKSANSGLVAKVPQ